ncbi:Uncharacterised protein [Mycobacteroides abscessus subsp. abscessus]|nr:Uncharacterised protein [Mycobacteroides abscessus subsp. abscessus]
MTPSIWMISTVGSTTARNSLSVYCGAMSCNLASTRLVGCPTSSIAIPSIRNMVTTSASGKCLASASGTGLSLRVFRTSARARPRRGSAVMRRL